jgi:hypothetical protein
MEDIILYHGSKGGIVGDIKPDSRKKCDFGKGFYMGSSEKQAKSLICENRNPILYKMKLKLTEIDEKRILKLDGKDWLYAILAARELDEQFSSLQVARTWKKKLDRYDVIIGPIADDRMLDVLERFSSYTITDETFMKCLQSVDYGLQYVLKSELACSKIEIMEEKRLHGDELNRIRQDATNLRINSVRVIEEIVRSTRGQGRYLDEIIKTERKKERDIRER